MLLDRWPKSSFRSGCSFDFKARLVEWESSADQGAYSWAVSRHVRDPSLWKNIVCFPFFFFSSVSFFLYQSVPVILLATVFPEFSLSLCSCFYFPSVSEFTRNTALKLSTVKWQSFSFLVQQQLWWETRQVPHPLHILGFIMVTTLLCRKFSARVTSCLKTSPLTKHTTRESEITRTIRCSVSIFNTFTHYGMFLCLPYLALFVTL